MIECLKNSLRDIMRNSLATVMKERKQCRKIGYERKRICSRRFFSVNYFTHSVQGRRYLTIVLHVNLTRWLTPKTFIKS